MPDRWFWAVVFWFFQSGQALYGQAQNLEFSSPWQLTEDESGLQDWRHYYEKAVPFGFNKIVWLQQTLPTIEALDQGLFFANGLEGLEVFIDGTMVYQYGEFSKTWISGSSQRWHFIPLNFAHSGKELRIRTHYTISYMTRTLYPSFRKSTDVYTSQWEKSISYTLVSGGFIVLSIICLTIAAQRRKMDVFFYFGGMTLCSAFWTMFNQDSLVKQFTGLPEASWLYLDLAGLFIAVPSLFAFFSNVLNDSSRLVLVTTKCLWYLAALATIAAALRWLNPWYLLPIMHLLAMPALVVIIPRMVISSFRHNKEARYLILGAVCVSIAGLHDALRYVIHSPFVQLIPIGISIMFGSMVGVLAERYRHEQSQTINTQARLLDDIQNLNSKLQDHLHKVEAIVEEKTMEIRSILGHIQQGIFMVEGHDLQLNREYSAYLEQLLDEHQMGGRSFRSTFLDKCQFGSDQKETMVSILVLTLGETEASFDLNAANLPLEASIQLGNAMRILELSWAPILDDAGIIQKILVTARDVTSLRELQKAAQRSQEEMQIVQIILAKKPERFARFLHSLQNLLELIVVSSAQIESIATNDLRYIFRNIHTLKGNARSFDLDPLAELCHEAEQYLLNRNWTEFNSTLEHMREILEHYGLVLQQRIGWNHEVDHIMLDRRQMERYFLQHGTPHDLETIILHQTFVSGYQIANEAFAGMQRIADDLGKHKPKLDLDVDGFFFPQATEEVLSHCLGHLFRNALDHSLEAPDERLAAGKPSFGRISVEMQTCNEKLLIICRDDGRGLDVGAVEARARERNLLQDVENMSEARVEELIFFSGFTTRNQASLVSGRGVGLEAVRAFLSDIHGEIHLLVRNKDTARQHWLIDFELSLPAGTWVERRPLRNVKQAS